MYCLNNPVNRTDSKGNLSWKSVAKLAIGVGAIAIGAGIAALTGPVGFVAIATNALKTACAIERISAATETLYTAVISAINGDDLKTMVLKACEAAFDGFCSGFMNGGIMAGMSMVCSSLFLHSNGILIGQSEKSMHGRVDLFYGNPKGKGSTIISINNKSGECLFRIDTSIALLLHVHYGKTNAAMKKHRNIIIKIIIGVISCVKW